jgi:hypothetical protein
MNPRPALPWWGRTAGSSTYRLYVCAFCVFLRPFRFSPSAFRFLFSAFLRPAFVFQNLCASEFIGGSLFAFRFPLSAFPEVSSGIHRWLDLLAGHSAKNRPGAINRQSAIGSRQYPEVSA